MIKLDSDDENQELTILFKRISFENKYINRDRFRFSTKIRRTYSEKEREELIEAFPARYKTLLEEIPEEHQDLNNLISKKENPVILLKAKLYDEISEIENAVLVLQELKNISEEKDGEDIDTIGNIAEYYQVKVKFPRPGRYLLKIEVVAIYESKGYKEELEGTNYWIHYNEGQVNKGEELTANSEAEHDKDLAMVHFLTGKDCQSNADKYFHMQR
jgi:hypothetical protein